MTDMDSKRLAPTSEQEEAARQEEASFHGGEDSVTQSMIDAAKHAMNLETLSVVRKVVPYIVLVFFLSFAGTGLLFFGIWVLHMLTPTWMHWLNMEQIDDIQTVLFSGASGVLISRLAQKYLI